MTRQEPRPRKRLGADGALVRQVMGEQVHGEGRRANIRFAAHLARLGVLRGQRLVRLLVAGEVRAAGKMFAALQALVLVAALVLQLLTKTC